MPEPKIDVTSKLTQREAGMIITQLRADGTIVKYRELEGFSPAKAAELRKLKDKHITAEKLAELAGRGAKEIA